MIKIETAASGGGERMIDEIDVFKLLVRLIEKGIMRWNSQKEFEEEINEAFSYKYSDESIEDLFKRIKKEEFEKGLESFREFYGRLYGSIVKDEKKLVLFLFSSIFH